MALDAGEKSKFIPKFGPLTASDLTDGIDMTDAQQLSITGTTHTTDEAGCKVIITKKLRAQMKEDVYKAAGLTIGNAMAKKIDQDGIALFDGLSNSVGSTGTTFTLDYLNAAVSQMLGQSEPVPMPYNFVCHPYQLHEVVDRLATPGTSITPPELQTAALRDYFRGTEKLFGTRVFSTGNITPDGSSDAKGAVFGSMCFIYLVGWEPENWLEEDKSLRGWEIGIVADYGMVEEDDNYGREMYFAASAPAS